MRVAVCQYPIEYLGSFAAWQTKMQRFAALARKAGATLLVFPEYAALELLSALPEDAAATLPRQLKAMQPLVSQYLNACRDLARSHQLWLLSGSIPVACGGEFRNRAWLCSPSGNCACVEKLMMTPFEREWGVHSGDGVCVVRTPIGTIGVAICYDSEYPLIVRNLVDHGAELVLVPSCTDTLAGANRVRIACRARALENQCFVAQSVTVGLAPWTLSLDENHGIAGVFCPPDQGFPEDGILAEGSLDKPGWVFADLDFEHLANVRRTGQVRNHEDWTSPNHLVSRVHCHDLK